MSKRFVGNAAVVLGSLVALSWTNAASAQEWLKDRRIQNGAGIRSGDFEIHPGIAGEIGYDSNWFLRSDKTGPNIINSGPVGAGVIRITPSISVTTVQSAQRSEAGESTASQEGPKVAFNGGLSATYREFLTGDDTLRSQRNISGNANAQVLILPGRPWGANIFGNYDRTIQPTALSGNPDLSFNRDDLGAGLEVIAQPNSGTLDWRLGYQFHTTLFEQSEGRVFDNLTHSIYTRGRWKFRPRTALLYDGSASFRSYNHDEGAATALHQSTPVRARLGMSGLITPRFSLLAMAGYAASFFDTGGGRDQTTQQYDSVIGQIEAKFFPTANPTAGEVADASLVLSSIAVGYTRDYQTSYLGDFYGSDRGYAKIQYFFAGRALISLEGGVGAIEYPTVFFPTPLGQAPAQPAASPFTDIRADATLFGEYRVLQGVGINATVRYTENFSNTAIRAVNPANTGGGPVNTNAVFDMSWRRFEAYLGLRWFL